MLDDIQKSIKAQLHERVSSPLLVSFGLSWLAWNYRFVITLTSSLPLDEKLSFIDTQIFPSWQQVLIQGGICPLITTLLLIFAYPVPAKYVYEYWRRRQRELKEIQQKIDDETPLTREESRELRREALKVSLEFDQEIQSKSEEIARLKEYNEVLQQENSKLRQENLSITLVPQKQSESSTPSNKTDELDNSQIQMLNEIAQAPWGIQEETLLVRSRDDRVLAEYNLGELYQKGLVTKDYNRRNHSYDVKVTHSGRTLLVKQKQAEKST